ncbi:hypothetical protein [Bifidobacterium sp.]|jgi:hypothetical protein|uniref:hypothetical protein n=1 Tax=Bifidobacterium sp. TaxID=41200 RepID=UPI0025BBF8CF|nr:hypothetical protein [Bifidobacterium sp.]MCH4209489.1 hypothetical protein [Bifidobacterium sp.]MCI1225265.1 hypothetical protein [Bifidobacterium sp.]
MTDLASTEQLAAAEGVPYESWTRIDADSHGCPLSYRPAPQELGLRASGDDFIQAEPLDLAALPAASGADFERRDWKVAKGETPGHVFPICMTWFEEIAAVFGMIRDFTYARL